MSNLQYVCTRCGKKVSVDTHEPRCECGGLFELDFKAPAWDEKLIDKKEWSQFRYRAFMAIDDDTTWRSVTMGEGMTPIIPFDKNVMFKAKPEKEMNAIEKAMAKKKADEQKEKKISLGNNSVVIPVSSGGRADPFLPFGQAVVSSAPKFDIVAPPLEIPEADPAVDKILDFKLSGILFDAVRPSAILNIDGAEQLVHKGDVVMGYQVINITRKSVVVKYGTNTYEISAGQSLEQGVNLNNNSALSKQFGGAYSADSKGAIKFD